MKEERIYIMLLSSYVVVPTLLYLMAGSEINIWREIISVLIVLASLTFLLLLFKLAHKNDSKILLKGGLLDVNGEEIELVYCDNCLAPNKKGTLFCRNCNSDLRVIVCPICGNENQYNQQYCLNCDSILQNPGKHV